MSAGSQQTRFQKAPPMGGAFTACGPSGQDTGGVPPMIPPAFVHRCNCRWCNTVLDVGHAGADLRSAMINARRIIEFAVGRAVSDEVVCPRYPPGLRESS